MRRLFRCGPAFVALAAACGSESSALDDSVVRIDVGPIIAGTNFERRVEAPGLSAAARISGGTPEWFARGEDGAVVLRFVPATVGEFATTVVATDQDRTITIIASGTARAPRMTVFPTPVVVSALSSSYGHAMLSAQVEADLPFRFRDLPCADGPCLFAPDGSPLRDGAWIRRGLVRLQLRIDPESGAPAFDTVTVETCDHPECRQQIPLVAADADATCGDRLAFVGRVALGSEVSATLSCLEGAAVVTEGPFIVEPTPGGARVTFRPEQPGPATITVATPRGPAPLWGMGVEAPACDLRVRPDPFNFGVIPVGVQTERTVRATNVGTAPCLISGVEIEGIEPRIPFGAWVARGAEVDVPVTLRPQTAGDLQSEAKIHVAGGVHHVALSAVVRADEVGVYPDRLTFRSLQPCGVVQSVTVVNNSARPITVTDARTRRPFRAAAPSQTAILPGQSVQIDVRFEPPQIQSYADTLRIALLMGDGATEFREVQLEGEAQMGARIVDSFVQIGPPKFDTLMVMVPQPQLQGAELSIQQNLQVYTQFLQATGRDGRVAVLHTGTSTGIRFQPIGPHGERQWTPDQGDPDVTRWIPTAYTATTALVFDTIMAALQPENPDFLSFYRSDAILEIIVISTSDDESMMSLDTYLSFALSIKGFRNTNLFAQSAITGPQDGCSNDRFSATHGERLIEAVNRTGGVFSSICVQDWSRVLEDLSTTAFGFKSRFFLSSQPIPETLEVRVNGTVIPQVQQGGVVYWTYDFSTNSINFSPLGTPEPLAEIDVSYVLSCL